MKGNYKKGEIIRIDIKTGEIKEYPSQFDASLDGFNTVKIGHSCRSDQLTHKGYFFCYRKDYNENTYINRLYLNKKPHNLRNICNLYKNCKVCKIEKYYNEYEMSSSLGILNTCKKCSNVNKWKNTKSNRLLKVKAYLRTRFYKALLYNQWPKRGKFKDYIGCSQDDLIKHLESQFQPGMTWDNHGEWHIDHIVPLASAKDEQELIKLCHYMNLQPLWAFDNLSKGSKINSNLNITIRN